MLVLDLISFLQSHHPNQLHEDIMQKNYPEIYKQIIEWDFKTPYPLSFRSRKVLLKNKVLLMPVCETCGEPINKFNSDFFRVLRFCSLSCSYKGQRMTEEQIEVMKEHAKIAWTLERKKKFIEGVKVAAAKGRYDASREAFKKKRREDPVFREKQRRAAQKMQQLSPIMSNKSAYDRMVEAKKKQFSGYALPSWYYKGQFEQACYNPRPIPFFLRLIEDLNLKGPYYFGNNEKKFGRYFVDFFSELEHIVIEWN